MTWSLRTLVYPPTRRANTVLAYITRKWALGSIKPLKFCKSSITEVNVLTYFQWVLFCLLWSRVLCHTLVRQKLKTHFTSTSRLRTRQIFGKPGRSCSSRDPKSATLRTPNWMSNSHLMKENSKWTNLNRPKKHYVLKCGLNFFIRLDIFHKQSFGPLVIWYCQYFSVCITLFRESFLFRIIFLRLRSTVHLAAKTTNRNPSTTIRITKVWSSTNLRTSQKNSKTWFSKCYLTTCWRGQV